MSNYNRNQCQKHLARLARLVAGGAARPTDQEFADIAERYQTTLDDVKAMYEEANANKPDVE